LTFSSSAAGASVLHMPTESKIHFDLEIAHVLFIDVVGYSKLLTDDQRKLLAELNALVRNTPEFGKAEAEDKLVRLPTGDGMALAFFSTADAPARCALEISAALASHPQLPLRMGINTGPISGTVDVNDRSNLAGMGINMAKRIMDCADAGHILLSKRTADDLAQYSYWRPYMHPLGPCEVKHGEMVELVNLYDEKIGNPTIPQRMRQVRAARHSQMRRRVAYIFVAILAGVALLLTSLWRRQPVKAPAKSIAVLPFENLSDDPANEYFAGGIQDDVLTNLAKLGDLKVICRTSVAQYKGTKLTVHEIGKALGVGAILEGSVRRSGNEVRVNVQLIDTTNDEHIWAENYDRDLTNVFAIQSDLALRIASTLHSQLSPAERARLQQRPTENPEAYLTYLEAQDAMTKARSLADLEHIAQLYEKAITLDPSFALGLAQLSYISGTIYQANGSIAALEKAKAAAGEALRLQPRLPEAHLALGYVYYRGDADYDRALRELAIAKNGLPNDPEVLLVIGSIERRQGKWRESTADLEKAASVNPKDPFLWTNVGTNYQALRNFPSAAQAYDRGIQVDPEFFANQYLRARLDIDWKADLRSLQSLYQRVPALPDPDGQIAYGEFELKLLQGKYREALQHLEASPRDSFAQWHAGIPLPKTYLAGEACRLMNDSANARAFYEQARAAVEKGLASKGDDASRHALLGEIYAGLGLNQKAISEGERAAQLLPESKDAFEGPLVTLRLAKICALAGDPDRAVSLLEHSLSSPAGITSSALKIDPAWDILRSNSRFQALLSTASPSKPTTTGPPETSTTPNRR
jgi:TolB-like protein/class 3 adenylate cyclase/Tfp pilus assembly protein PilF